jgi:quercetin dioxygenase-like cupin family protein
VDIDGQKAELPVGDAVIIPSGTLHQLSAGAGGNRHIGVMGKVGAGTFMPDGQAVDSDWQT